MTADQELMARTQATIALVCDSMKAFLLEKNRLYSNSAQAPLRVFAKSDKHELINARIDDKLSRIANGVKDSEDTVKDLIGYLILKRVNELLDDPEFVAGEAEFARRFPVVFASSDARHVASECRACTCNADDIHDVDECYDKDTFDVGESEDRSRRAQQAREFHRLFDIVQPEVPTILPDKDIRRRLILVAEEAMELVEACCADEPKSNSTLGWKGLVQEWSGYLRDRIIMAMPIKVDIAKCVDALADIDYVVAGFADEIGVDMLPIADEVHRANCTKAGSPKDPVTGKVTKSKDFVPPRVLEELIKQGWTQ